MLPLEPERRGAALRSPEPPHLPPATILPLSSSLLHSIPLVLFSSHISRPLTPSFSPFLAMWMFVLSASLFSGSFGRWLFITTVFLSQTFSSSVLNYSSDVHAGRCFCLGIFSGHKRMQSRPPPLISINALTIYYFRDTSHYFLLSPPATSLN